jgi:hypothetical protein
MMIPEHSVEQVLETGALKSLHPSDVLEAARRMDRQRREHDERYSREACSGDILYAWTSSMPKEPTRSFAGRRSRNACARRVWTR